MELPIAAESYQASPDALVRAIKRADVIMARMTGEETQLDGATVITDPSRPRVFGCNIAAEVTLGQEQSCDQLLDRIESHFAEAGCRCGMIVCADAAWPAELERGVAARGYQRQQTSVYLLTDYAPPSQLNARLQIIPGRAAYKQLRDFRKQTGIEQFDCDESLADDIAAAYIDMLDEPRLEVFLGRLDGEAVGVLNLVTLGQIGVIDWIYTLESARNQGVATTLLANAIDHCQRALFEQVILETEDDNTEAIRIYQRFGFKPVASVVSYIRAGT